MARVWAITGPAKTGLSKNVGEASYTVTNITAQAVRGLIRILPEGAATSEMFKVVGESTLDWAPNETKQVTVQINAEAAPVGTYVYSFAVVSETNPSELADRISSSFDVLEERKKFPVGLLLAILAGLLVIGGAIAAFFIFRDGAVKIPPVNGLSVTDASQRLQEEGLVVGPTPTETPSDQTQGEVIGTQPSEGTEVEKGHTVTLVVSSGPATFELEDVQGDPEADAIGNLEAHCEPTPCFVVDVRLVPNKDLDGGLAVRTEPPAGAMVARGANVTLFVSSLVIKGQLNIDGNETADLDEGIAAGGGSGAADLYLDENAEVLRSGFEHVDPAMDALFFSVGNPIEPPQCRQQVEAGTGGTSAISYNQISTGLYLCVRTTEGRFAEIRVVDFDEGGFLFDAELRFDYWTWDFRSTRV